MKQNTTHPARAWPPPARSRSPACAVGRRRRRRRRRRRTPEPAPDVRSRAATMAALAERGHDHDRHEVRPAAVRLRGPVTASPRASTSRSARSSRLSSASPRTTSSGRSPSRPTASRSSRTARSTSSSRPTRSPTSARRSSPSPARTTWRASRSWSLADNEDIKSEDDLVGQPVCSVTGSTPAANLERVRRRGRCSTDTYSQLPRAARRRHGRRGHDRQRRSSPASPRRTRASSRSSASPSPRSRYGIGLALEDTDVPRVDQRRARDGRRGRQLRGAPGTRRPARCCRSSSRPRSTATDRSDARAGGAPARASATLSTPTRPERRPHGAV